MNNEIEYNMDDLANIFRLAEDVLLRWYAEKDGAVDVGRTLPAEYLWFHGDGETNAFTDDFRGGNVWDWSLPGPYGEKTK